MTNVPYHTEYGNAYQGVIQDNTVSSLIVSLSEHPELQKAFAPL